MAHAVLADRLTAVTTADDPLSQRIEALRARREEARISVARLAAAAGLSSQSWYDTLKGERPVETVQAFEEALETLIANPDDIDIEPSEVVKVSSPGNLIEIEMTGDFGVRVVARADASNSDQLEALVTRIMRDLRGPKD